MNSIIFKFFFFNFFLRLVVIYDFGCNFREYTLNINQIYVVTVFSNGAESLNRFIQLFRTQVAFMKQENCMLFLVSLFREWNKRKHKGIKNSYY